jgi:xylan 1,4-beta-xylosidase
MYSSYTAAVFARKHALAEKHGVTLDGALTWAFEFEDQPYFAGFRALASNGLDLPVLNVFRMFSRMSGRRIEATSSGEVALDDMMRQGVRQQPDVAAFASSDGRKVCVMVWHYHDDDVPGPDAAVELTLAGLGNAGGAATLTHYRVDQDHANAYTAWKRLGSPIAPNDKQYAALEKAGQLATLGDSESIAIKEGAATLKFTLPRQGVSLLVLELPTAP